VAEAAVGMVSDVVFDTVPIVLVIANFPAAGANGEKFVQLSHFSKRYRKFTVGLGEVGGAFAHPTIQIDIQFLNLIVRTQRFGERLLEFGILFFELGNQHRAVLLDDERIVGQIRRARRKAYGGNLQRIQNGRDWRRLRDKLVRADRVTQAYVGRRRVSAAIKYESQWPERRVLSYLMAQSVLAQTAVTLEQNAVTQLALQELNA